MHPNNQQTADQTPKQVNQINFDSSQIVSVGRTFGSIFFTGQIVFSLIFIALGGFFASSLLDRSKTATAPATITNISQSSRYDSSQRTTETTCTLTYTFTTKGKNYSGTSTIGSSENCGRPTGSTLTVNYNPADPSQNTVDGKSSGVIGLIFLVIGLAIFAAGVFGLVRIRSGDKTRRSATNAQMELIANGFQELGHYWEPRRMTQAEAETIIDDINQRLAAQRRFSPIQK